MSCEVRIDCRYRAGFCAKCCAENPVVPLLREDFERLRRRLGDIEGYITWIHGVPVLKTASGACVFLDGATGACKVYEDRPLACRLYPLVYSKEKWVYADPRCPKASTIPLDVLVRCASLVEKFPEMLKKDWSPRMEPKPSLRALPGFSSASVEAFPQGNQSGR